MRVIKRARERGGPTDLHVPGSIFLRAFLRAADELGLGEDEVAERNRLLDTMLETSEQVKGQPHDVAEKILFEAAMDKYRFGFPPSH